MGPTNELHRSKLGKVTPTSVLALLHKFIDSTNPNLSKSVISSFKASIETYIHSLVSNLKTVSDDNVASLFSDGPSLRPRKMIQMSL